MQMQRRKTARSQLQALVKVVVLPLSSTGITTSWHQQQSTGIKLKLQRIQAGVSNSAKPAASTSALAGPAVPTTRAKPSMAPAAKRSSPSKEAGDVAISGKIESHSRFTRQHVSVHACLFRRDLHVTAAGTMSCRAAVGLRLQSGTPFRIPEAHHTVCTPAWLVPCATKALRRLRSPKPATCSKGNVLQAAKRLSPAQVKAASNTAERAIDTASSSSIQV